MCTLRNSVISQNICILIFLVTASTCVTSEATDYNTTSINNVTQTVSIDTGDTSTTEYVDRTDYNETLIDISDSDTSQVTESTASWSSTSTEEWSTDNGTEPTFFPTVTMPNDQSTTFQPSSTTTKSGPPTWAIVLISILICFSILLTGLFLLRKYCARRRKEERRYLLSRSQEGYFFGDNEGTNDL